MASMTDHRTSWREQLAEEMKEQHDAGPVLAYHPDQAAFDVRFSEAASLAYPGYPNGAPDVLAWTASRVYYVAYANDETLWMRSVPRNPLEITS